MANGYPPGSCGASRADGCPGTVHRSLASQGQPPGRGKQPATSAGVASLWNNLDRGLRLGIDSLERQRAGGVKTAATAASVGAECAQLVEAVDGLRLAVGQAGAPYRGESGECLVAEAARLRAELAARSSAGQHSPASCLPNSRTNAAQAQLDLLMELEQTRAQVAAARATRPGGGDSLASILAKIADARQAEGTCKAQLETARFAEAALRLELAAVRQELQATATASQAAACWEGVRKSRAELASVRGGLAAAGNVQARLDMALARNRQLTRQFASAGAGGSATVPAAAPAAQVSARPQHEDHDADAARDRHQAPRHDFGEASRQLSESVHGLDPSREGQPATPPTVHRSSFRSSLGQTSGQGALVSPISRVRSGSAQRQVPFRMPAGSPGTGMQNVAYGLNTAQNGVRRFSATATTGTVSASNPQSKQPRSLIGFRGAS